MIKVAHPGFFTTVQDLGRAGFLAFGIPRAGALDEYACRAANLLVGNEENAPLLELTMFGGSYEFVADGLVALGGADMAARLDGRPLGNWASHAVKSGQKLEFGYAEAGCRTYLAVAGGLDIAAVMGSRSTHVRSRMGGLAGRVLQKGDSLPFLGGVGRELTLPEGLRPRLDETPLIRVLPGPQEDAFAPGVFAVLESAEYLVEPDSDRMGYRLRGPELKHEKSADIISDALISGGVQVPGSGQPIIMLNDCQTTGGYTKLCFVISPDLCAVAQCRPGGRLRFKVVGEAAAEQARLEYAGRLRQVREFVQAGWRWRLLVDKLEYAVTVKEVKA